MHDLRARPLAECCVALSQRLPNCCLRKVKCIYTLHLSHQPQIWLAASLRRCQPRSMGFHRKGGNPCTVATATVPVTLETFGKSPGSLSTIVNQAVHHAQLGSHCKCDLALEMGWIVGYVHPTTHPIEINKCKLP